MDPKTSAAEDPRPKSTRYHKGAITKFDENLFDFAITQFVIDDQYCGDVPKKQVSIDNINDNIDEKFLRKELTKFGKIRTLEIIRNPITKQHLGMAKIQFEQVRDANTCVEQFDGKQLMGRQLNVFLDCRFARIEKMKEIKMQPPPPVQKPLPAPSIPNASLNPHLNPHQPILPLHPSHLQKPNSIGTPIPSPISLDYQLTTPGSFGSMISTPDSIPSRPRLGDRIAKLMKQPNCVLSTIVAAPIAPQASPTYSAFSLSETSYDYANSSYYQLHSNMPPNTLDRQRPDLHDHRSTDNNNHNHNYQNHNNSYHKYDNTNNKSSKYSEHNSDDDWNPKVPEKVKPPLEIELTEIQIDEEVLPYCYDIYYKYLSENLLTTIFKKLRENHGYQILEKNQTAYKTKQDAIKRQRDLEKKEKKYEESLEIKFMSRNRAEPFEAPKPRVNLIRQRTRDHSSIAHDYKRRGEVHPKRVNRSSAYEPERHGSHTSMDSDSDSDSSSSASDTASSTSSRSRSSSSSSSRFSDVTSSSSSSSTSTRSRISNESEVTKSIKSQRVKESKVSAFENEKPEVTSSFSEPHRIVTNPAADSTVDAAESLLLLCSGTRPQESKANDLDEMTFNTKGQKRKKKISNAIESIASEHRSTKRLALDYSGVIGLNDENIDYSLKTPNKPLTDEEKQKLLDNIHGTLTEEDVKYLAQVHESDRDGYKSSRNRDVEIPFGSDYINKAHLSYRKHMIEGQKLAESGHPKWWSGCSRCDVIQVNEKGDEGTNIDLKDLTIAPFKSHVIQPTNSSRRAERGDQRRIAVLNPEIDTEIIKKYTQNALQMRVKNLRFSRSKIHKWGLFACEKIASGDAVIEYVGEKIRPSLADHREKLVYTNLPTHDGSSYFFRVDHDVIDATLKGNKARFINHSCNPNCIAKVIKHDNGTNSIVIYAKQVINEDEEITYDYKFPREDGEGIKCRCQAPNCHGRLN